MAIVTIGGADVLVLEREAEREAERERERERERESSTMTSADICSQESLRAGLATCTNHSTNICLVIYDSRISNTSNSRTLSDSNVDLANRSEV